MGFGFEDVLPFLHPLIALGTVAFLFHAATLGLRSRQRRGEAARPQHAARAPWALALVWVSALSGVAATWLWRPDLEVASGWHFWIGWIVVGVLSAGGLLSRRIHDDDTARRIHPALGLVALLFAMLQIFFGMPLLPF